ncbi:MAG: hypothetical protein JST59_02780 [Actinobacteria bacterium]|nr:hypothetical protein [Actinomycetota bacterium]
MAALLFYVLSLLVSKEWAANFTVPTSYLFYMLMPFWALAVVLVVEIVGSLVDQSDTYKEPENDKQCGASD